MKSSKKTLSYRKRFSDNSDNSKPQPNKKNMSYRQECRVAKAINGDVTKQSRIGDAFNENILVECKVTGKQQITIKKDFLIKIVRDAITRSKEPAFCFGFDEPIFGTDKDWIAFPLSYWNTLVNLMEKQDD